MTSEPFKLIHRNVAYRIKPDFTTVPDTLWGMVERIKVQTRYLEATTGDTMPKLKTKAREIRGMISMLSCVCDAPDLESALIAHLSVALQTATDNIRK